MTEKLQYLYSKSAISVADSYKRVVSSIKKNKNWNVKKSRYLDKAFMPASIVYMTVNCHIKPKHKMNLEKYLL